MLNGLVYLHASHILHRDLKPANILITSAGVVKIGDLGLARLTNQPLQPLFQGDKVVVTIWYRAPELLLGAKHYNNAIDCWAVGCVFAEMIGLKPIFKGEEAKIDPKKTLPFQREQLTKIFEVLGPPTVEAWPGLATMPDFQQFQQMNPYVYSCISFITNKCKLGHDGVASFTTGGEPIRFDQTKVISCFPSSSNMIRDVV